MKKLIVLLMIAFIAVVGFAITPTINYLASGNVVVENYTTVASGSYINIPYLYYDSDLTLVSTGTTFPKLVYADTQLSTTAVATYTYTFDDNYTAKINIEVPSTSVADWKVYLNTTDYSYLTLEASDSLELILDTKYIYKMWFVSASATTAKLDYTIWNNDYLQ